MLKSIQKGFTLIELMIVVAIIGILAAIAIPAYQDYLIRSQVSEGLTMAAAAKAGVAEFYANKGIWPSSNSAAGIGAASDIQGKYVRASTIANGGIEVTYGNEANASKLGWRDGRPDPGRQRQWRRDLEVRQGDRPERLGLGLRQRHVGVDDASPASTSRPAAAN